MPTRTADGRLTVGATPPTLSGKSMAVTGGERKRSEATGRPLSSRPRSSERSVLRRLVITVCPRERGVVVLPVEQGGRTRRLDAPALVRALLDLVAARRLDGRVGVREGCAGGCSRTGPNVDVTIHPVPGPGEKFNNVALGWKTYVYSLASLDCLARIIDDNLRAR